MNFATGLAFYAQATTCEQYLKVTWPETGDDFLSLMQTALDTGSASKGLRHMTNFVDMRKLTDA